MVENDPGSFNRWSIEFGAGQAKGIRPYADGFCYSNTEKTLPVDFNHYELGLRYMISPTFGLKLDLAYDNLKNQDNSGSLPFEMQQFRAGIQGVVNAVRLFNFEEQAGRFADASRARGRNEKQAEAGTLHALHAVTVTVYPSSLL